MKQIILPTYTTKLPSTGKTVTFRPFTVREEKALLLALQENNLDTVAVAIKNTIEVCTSGVINPDNYPYYDVEYLFLQIRSKSVGEILNLSGSCDCNENSKTDFTVDISTVTVAPEPKESFKIKIPDIGYTVVMRHPSLSDFISAFKSVDEDDTGTETVAKCITQIYSEDEVFDWTLEEKIEFVESMSPKQQKDITAFLDEMPTVNLDVSYVCKHCGKEHKQIMSGFENFFI
jgi:hypothetical protein